MNKHEALNIKDHGYFANNNKQELDGQIVIPFHSSLGEKYFTNSNYQRLFFRLAQCFVPQQHVTTCGIASSVMVLNAIHIQNRIKRPIDNR